MSEPQVHGYDGGILRIPDLQDRALPWMCKVFGMTVNWEVPEEGLANLGYAQTGALTLRAVPAEELFAVVGPAPRFAVRTPDYDRAVEAIAEGLVEVGPAMAGPGGARVAEFRVPDGPIMRLLEDLTLPRDSALFASEVAFYPTKPENAEWFVRMLGLTIAVREDGYTTLRDRQGTPIYLEHPTAPTWSEDRTDCGLPFFRVVKGEEFIALHAALIAAGAAPQDIEGSVDRLATFQLRDPDGNRIGIWTFQED